MHNAARAFRAFFSYLVRLFRSIFSLNPNLGFLSFKATKNERKIFRKRLLCYDDDDIDDDDDAEKRGRVLLHVILLIFDGDKNEP